MLNYKESTYVPKGCGPLLHRSTPNDAPLRQQVFQHVRASGRAARAEIARALDISAGSATTLTAQLISEGMIREVDAPARESGRGRPPVALEVVPEAAYVIGIKLAFKRHTAVLSDFAGNVIADAALPVAANRRDLAQLTGEIDRVIAQLLKNGSKLPSDISAIGLGLPGIVDYETGMVTWSSLLHDTEQDLSGPVSARYTVPVLVDNDTNMLTQSELWFGAGRSLSDFAIVTIENGVGMGLVVKNELYRGTHGMGLELGHTKVQLDGALCRCGQRGCLEAYLGDYALTREAAVALDFEHVAPHNSEELLDHLIVQAKDGNEAAQTIFRRAGRFLSVGLANVVQLFDPPLIILSGKRVLSESLYADEIFAETRRLTLSARRKPCEIEIHPWNDVTWARGGTAPALAALTDRMIGGMEAGA